MVLGRKNVREKTQADDLHQRNEEHACKTSDCNVRGV